MFAFAPVWSSLAQSFHIVAVDLLGFGGSERRDDLLSPRAMGEFLVTLVDELDIGAPHLVAPDVGTSAALFAAASRPGLLSSVVVGSGGAAVPLQLEGPLAEWVLALRYPDELPELAERLSGIETPVQIVAGRRDRVVPLANAEFLDARLPNSRLAIVDAGHFVWEEAADEYASIVLDWATGGYRTAAPR